MTDTEQPGPPPPAEEPETEPSHEGPEGDTPDDGA
jgi:hypothetical protein